MHIQKTNRKQRNSFQIGLNVIEWLKRNAAAPIHRQRNTLSTRYRCMVHLHRLDKHGPMVHGALSLYSVVLCAFNHYSLFRSVHFLGSFVCLYSFHVFQFEQTIMEIASEFWMNIEYILIRSTKTFYSHFSLSVRMTYSIQPIQYSVNIRWNFSNKNRYYADKGVNLCWEEHSQSQSAHTSHCLFKCSNDAQKMEHSLLFFTHLHLILIFSSFFSFFFFHIFSVSRSNISSVFIHVTPDCRHS